MGLRIVICDSPIFVQEILHIILYKTYDTKNKTNQAKKINNPAYDADKPAENRNPTYKSGNKT